MIRRPPLAALVALAALTGLLGGCKGPRDVGHFSRDAFYHSRDHYRIRYLDDGERRLLPQRWSLANFEHDDDGRPTTARQGSAYWTGYAVEHPRTGTREVRAERIDLRYQHEDGIGAIWARTVPTSETWREAPLDAILRDAVRGMASDRPRGLDLVGHPVAQGDRTAVEVVGQGDAVVDGLPARWATFDLANLRTDVVDRYSVVVVRPPATRWRYRRWSFPMLLILGYASPPGQHAALRPSFESFVRRVDVAR